MKNITVIFSHPNYEKSIANSVIIDELQTYDNVNVRHIDSLYPDRIINVKIEQNVLLMSDVIVFQFPMFWFNVPSSLKNWIDTVLNYGFAYGKDGEKLQGKEFLISTTVGGAESSYINGKASVEDLLCNIKTLGSFTKMKSLPLIYTCEMSNKAANPDDRQRIKLKALSQAQKIIDVLKLESRGN